MQTIHCLRSARSAFHVLGARLRRGALPRRVALATLLFAAVGGAHIIATSGACVYVNPPPSVMPGDLLGPDILAFDEEQDCILPGPVAYDAKPRVRVKEEHDLNGGVIPKDTCVSSHYLHYQPALLAASAVGGARFDGRILGVELLQASLDATNFLGAPGTLYPTVNDCGGAGASPHCGLELSPTKDMIRIEDFQVEVSVNALSPGDRVRVITEGHRERCWQQHRVCGSGLGEPKD